MPPTGAPRHSTQAGEGQINHATPAVTPINTPEMLGEEAPGDEAGAEEVECSR